MKHSVLSRINNAFRRIRHAETSSISHSVLRGIPHDAGGLRDVVFKFVVAALLLSASELGATSKSTTANLPAVGTPEHVRLVMERIRATRASEKTRAQAHTASTLAPLATAEDGHWSHMSISALRGHVAIYDPVRDRVLVYGGADNGTLRTDLWARSMSDAQPWSKLAPTGPTPPQPAFGSAIYDLVRDRMLFLASAF